MKRTVLIIFSVLLISGVARATPPLMDLPRIMAVEGGTAEPLQASQDKIQCKVRFIYALEKEGPTDKGLERFKKVIKGHKSLKSLGQANLTIPRHKTREAAVPNGTRMSVTFVEKLLEGKDSVLLRLEVKIPPKMKKSVLRIPNRSTHLVGQAYKKGSLIIALTCNAE